MSVAYVELLRDPRWQRRRLEILKRDDWRCRWCGDTQNNLQVDHRRYNRGAKPWEYEDRDLVTLCAGCHKRITELRRKAMDLLGEFNVYELPIVVAHIEALLPETAERTPKEPEDLRLIEAEKALLISQPYTAAASHRVEELDARLETFWEATVEAGS